MKTPVIQLFITDMDSTLIGQETIDEIAGMVGVKSQVAKITEAAMRGELDFQQALVERVALLEGLPESTLRQVYCEKLHANPGAEMLFKQLANLGIKSAVVSGGFCHFVNWISKDLGIDFALANSLEVVDGILTGKVTGAIVDGDKKAEYLQQLCQQLNITPKQVMAVGDGANDIPMLQIAGIGVAYYAKPIVRQYADVSINDGGLDQLLQWL